MHRKNTSRPIGELESEMRRVRRMAQSVTAQPLARLKSIGRVATAVLDNDHQNTPSPAEGQPNVRVEYQIEVCPECGSQRLSDAKYCYGPVVRHEEKRRYVPIHVVPVIDPDGNVL